MDSKIHTCHVEEFLNSYLQNDHTDTVDTVLDELKKQRVLVARGRSVAQRASSSTQKPPFTHVFKGFKTLFRSGSTKPERILKSFQTIGNAVRKALGKITGATVNEFEVRAMDSTGDACITPNRDGGISPPDVVVPVRVTGRRTDRAEEDENKDLRYISHVNRILNEDARRKFAYGIIFEHDCFSLWFMHRSRVAKSLPLKVNQHPDALVRLLVALFLAKEEQLGYDPLVTRLSDGSYVYELPPDGERPSSVYYRTVALLSQYHSPSLTGRRARVWRVKQVVSPTDPRRVHGTIDRVLKDVLLDATMKTEAEIQQQLFHDIDAFSQDANWRNRDILKEFDQTTIDSIAEALEGGNFRRYFSTIVDKHIDFLSSTLSSPSSPVTSPRNRRCLFVYEYFCTPLYSVPTLGEVFDIVKQCLTALRLMFCAGWVHRDVSPGNILAVRQTPGSPWRVQLSDLEFARRFPDVGAPPSSQITGTPPFMACEIHTSKYLLPPPTLERIPPGGKVPVVPRPKGPVVYHYQHDLESLWWIVLWIVTMRVRQNLPRRFGEAMFLSEAGMRNGLARTTLFSECIADDDMFLESLPPSLESLAVPLENLRYDLYAAYTSRNQEDRINDIGTYSYIMGRAFTLFFDDVGNSRSEWESVDLVVEHDAPYPIRTSTVVSGPHPRPSYPVLTLNNPSPKKRQLQDTDTQGRPAKRARCSPTVNRPVTRSMTRQDGPITRSQSRRLLQIRQGRC